MAYQRLPVRDPRATSSDALHLFRRRWTALFALPIQAAFLASFVYGLVMAISLLTGWVAWATVAVLAIGILAITFELIPASWRAFIGKSPALLLDARGLTDVDRGIGPIPWSEIESIDLDYGDGDTMQVRFVPGSRYHGGRGKVLRSVKRAFNGGDLAIPLGGLVYEPRRLQRAVDHFLSQSRSGASRDVGAT